MSPMADNPSREAGSKTAAPRAKQAQTRPKTTGETASSPGEAPRQSIGRTTKTVWVNCASDAAGDPASGPRLQKLAPGCAAFHTRALGDAKTRRRVYRGRTAPAEIVSVARMIASNLCKTQCPFATMRTNQAQFASSFLCAAMRANADDARRGKPANVSQKTFPRKRFKAGFLHFPRRRDTGRRIIAEKARPQSADPACTRR